MTEIAPPTRNQIQLSPRYCYVEPDVTILTVHQSWATCECRKCKTVFDFDDLGTNALPDETGEFLTPVCPDCDLPVRYAGP